ncbi:metal ABC transporter substrate-binding protein [Methylobacterium dankookense]|uniref:Manganese-binding lipoprotein MntA n=1 Tax=Methylobacterium dankookense TaxID=560405 RepID=A0A564FSJ6_9HYPH|nr:metal ABC transporter substrate-binding protein [Methylobacterium dankookense]GJD57179.1 Manganese-binding lipoprotein MntA [Methylobacterium dankookense]VUF10798.1 Manganese-binding lipoprotein MntA [Methylobacterium dankookense]
MSRAAGGIGALLILVGLALPAAAAEPLRAVATFSILADLVRQVGGPHVSVTSLVAPGADAHGFSPAPADSRALAQAQVIVVNGLGFEGWIDRLIRASGAKAPVVVASAGVRTIAGNPEHDHDHGEKDGHAHGAEHASEIDPHAWQSVANVKTYIANIRDGLAKADPAHAEDYARNATAYTAALDRLEGEIRQTIAAIPTEHRRIITTHDSFGYFSAAYGLAFLAPQGVSTASEASPRDVARIIRQIRRDKVPAVFLETIADPRLMQQIARESGARIGGKVYSDSLSPPDGPAPTYLDLMRANLGAFRGALGAE